MCKPEARPHVVEDEDDPVIVAELAHAGQKALRRQLRVVSRVVAKRREHHAGDRAAILLDQPRQPFEIVVAEVQHVGAIFGRDPIGHRADPRMSAVIRAGRGDDLSAAGEMPRDHRCPGAYVGAVFGEHRPIGERRDLDQIFRQLDPERGRRVEAVALLGLAARRFLDAGMAMAEHDRAVGAHVVDVLVAINVPYVGALAAREERRIRAHREQARRLMAVDAAGNDFLGAREQRFAAIESVGFHHRLLIPNRRVRARRAGRMMEDSYFERATVKCTRPPPCKGPRAVQENRGR